MASQNILFERYLNIRSAYSPAFDPHGGRIAFLTDITGVPQIWMIDSNGGWPNQLTFYEDRITGIRWSPNGDYLLFTMDTAGDERHQIYLLDSQAPGNAIPIDHDTEVMHIFGTWSPDGKSIAYASNKRNRSFMDVYVQDVPTGEPRLVYQQDGWNSVDSWSPDGRFLVISHSDTNLYNHLLLLDLDTLEARQLTPSGDLSAYQSIQWSADSSGFYLSTNHKRDFKALASMDSASGELTFLAELLWDVEAVELSHDGRKLAYIVNEAGYSKAYIRDLASKDDRPIEGLPGGTLMNPRGSEALAWSPDDSYLAVTVNSPRLNADIWLWEATTGKAVKITHSATGGVPQDSFVEPELVSFTTFDEREIPAFLYTPKNAKADGTNPVIMHVHGGPEGQERPQFTANYQYFVQRGYCVIATNVRGSTGYGREYSHLDDVRNRMDSVHDLKYAWQWLIDSKWADPKRIAIMGGSYGGFMVLSAITTYPDLWAAAVELYGISNFLTFFENTSSYRRKLRAQEYGDPEKDRDFLMEISPINHLDNIQAPLIVLHGATDPRVPIGETEQLVEEIREKGGLIEYIRFEDEGHGFVRKANKMRAYPAIAEFLDKYIMAD